MPPELEDYLSRRRDSKREREVARLLRQLPEEERFLAISQAIERRSVVGLALAHSCLQRPKYFEALLLRGLEVGDASSIKHWLGCVIPRLGWRRTSGVLSRAIETDPVAVGKALYWLPSYIGPNGSSANAYYQQLRAGVVKVLGDSHPASPSFNGAVSRLVSQIPDTA